MSGEVERNVEELAKKLTPLRLKQARYVFDALYLSAILRKTGGNVTEAARLAGVNREAIQRIIKRENQ